MFANKEVPFLFLAMSKTSDADLFETTAESVRTIAKESNGKIIAVYLNTDDKSASQVLTYLDLKSEDYPTYRILNLEKVSWWESNDLSMVSWVRNSKPIKMEGYEILVKPTAVKDHETCCQFNIHVLALLVLQSKAFAIACL